MKEQTTSWGCILVILAFNLIIGGWSVNYLLVVFVGKAIPFLAAALLGLIVGEFSVPVAIVVAVLRHFGVV